MRRKILFICLVLFSIFSLLMAASCGENEENNVENEPETNGGEVIEDEETKQQPTITLETLEALVFKDGTFEYDGELKKIEVENVPEGVEVSYHNNERSKPGEYKITATIKYGEWTVKKTAKLIINHKESVITAEPTQTYLIYGHSAILPEYSINNDEQTIEYKVYKDGEEVSINTTINPGTYEVEIIANKSTYYAECKKTVTLITAESLLGVSFADLTVTYDEQAHTIYLDGEDDLPTDYSVTYANNYGTEAGTYYATANVLDENGNVVETHAATLTILNPTNEEFEEFLDEFFVAYLSGDQLSINILVENPENYGLEHVENIQWYTYEPTTKEDIAKYISEFENLLDELEVFKDARLSKIQEVTYRNIESFIYENIDFYSIEDSMLMNLYYVDQSGGYVAEFSTYMEAYSFRTEQDIIDIIAYISSTEQAFPSYLQYLSDRAEKGYALSNYTINEMRGYLKKILDKGNSYYLADTINAHIDEVEFLSPEEIASYKEIIESKMDNEYMNGVQALYDGLEEHLNVLTATDEGYLTKYENGKELYLHKLESLFGIEDFDPEAYYAELCAMYEEVGGQSTEYFYFLLSKFNIQTQVDLDEFYASHVFVDGTPEEMMDYLKEFAPTIVPELQSEPDIVIKNMDLASATVSNAQAYYMKSPVDNTGSEEITLNPLQLKDKNELLATLAHEGYPGHLYSYVYSKETGQHAVNTIMTSTAHAEGWATYVQIKLLEYIKANNTDNDMSVLIDYYLASEIEGFLIESILDFGIHYEGWGIKEVTKFLSDNDLNVDAAEDIYNLIIEIPSVYAAYGYGKLVFVSLHNEAKEILGGHYDEIEFNSMLLSRGWSSLGELENTYNEYMSAKCHSLGLEFTER